MAEEADALKGEDWRAAWGRTWGKRFSLEGFVENVGSRPALYSRCLLYFAFIVAFSIQTFTEYKYWEYKCRSWMLSRFQNCKMEGGKCFILPRRLPKARYILFHSGALDVRQIKAELTEIPMSISEQLPLLYCFNCWLLMECNCCEIAVQKPWLVFSLACFVNPSLGPERLVNIVRVVLFLFGWPVSALFISWCPCDACRWHRYWLLCG